MDDNNGVKKSKKTLEEMIEEQASQIMADADDRAAKSAEMDLKNQEVQKEIERLKKIIADNNRKIGRNRKYVKYLAQANLFKQLISKFGLEERENSCKTPADYDALVNDMVKMVSGR